MPNTTLSPQAVLVAFLAETPDEISDDVIAVLIKMSHIVLSHIKLTRLYVILDTTDKDLLRETRKENAAPVNELQHFCNTLIQYHLYNALQVLAEPRDALNMVKNLFVQWLNVLEDSVLKQHGNYLLGQAIFCALHSFVSDTQGQLHLQILGYEILFPPRISGQWQRLAEIFPPADRFKWAQHLERLTEYEQAQEQAPIPNYFPLSVTVSKIQELSPRNTPLRSGLSTLLNIWATTMQPSSATITQTIATIHQQLSEQNAVSFVMLAHMIKCIDTARNVYCPSDQPSTEPNTLTTVKDELDTLLGINFSFLRLNTETLAELSERITQAHDQQQRWIYLGSSASDGRVYRDETSPETTSHLSLQPLLSDFMRGSLSALLRDHQQDIQSAQLTQVFTFFAAAVSWQIEHIDDTVIHYVGRLFNFANSMLNYYDRYQDEDDWQAKTIAFTEQLDLRVLQAILNMLETLDVLPEALDELVDVFGDFIDKVPASTVTHTVNLSVSLIIVRLQALIPDHHNEMPMMVRRSSL